MKEEMKEIPLSKIVECPWNPRKKWDIDDLAEDMSKRGQLQNILVRPNDNGKYEVVFGERRVMSARAGKLKKIWAKVQTLEDDQAMAMTFRENEVRLAFTSEEREELIYNMWESGHWGTHDDLAMDINVSKKTLGLLLKSYQSRKDLNISSGKVPGISTSTMNETEGLDNKTRKKVLKKISRGELSGGGKEVRKLATILKKSPKPIKDAILENKVDVEDVEELIEYGIPKDMVKPTVEEMTQRKKTREQKTKLDKEDDLTIIKGEKKRMPVIDFGPDQKRLNKFKEYRDKITWWTISSVCMIEDENLRREAGVCIQEIAEHCGDLANRLRQKELEE